MYISSQTPSYQHHHPGLRKMSLQLLLHNYTNSKNHLIRMYRSLLGSIIISYLSLAYAMASLLLLLVHLNATACSVEVIFLTLLTPTATRCYITMITPKHPFYWHWLVPYTYFYNVSRLIHNPTDNMGGYHASPSSTYLASEAMASVAFSP